jgi:TolB protein
VKPLGRFFVLLCIMGAALGAFAAAAPTTGRIAYLRGAEIRVIDADGANDNKVWSLPRPDLAETQGLTQVAWSPDGTQLAFTSGHEAVESWFASDVYVVNADGSGLRKITNPPAHDALSRYPTGAVRVTVRNGGLGSGTFFIVYVEGAPQPQSVALAPGASRTLTFPKVADLGAHPQPVVAMEGNHRWFLPGVDVRAGATVDAGTLNVLGAGMVGLGAYGVAWRHDGTELAYGQSRGAGVNRIPLRSPPGSHADMPILTGGASRNVTTWAFGPTAETMKELLLGGGMLDANIYLATEGEGSRGKLLVRNEASDIMVCLGWLPDASGFLFSKVSGGSGNIYRYTFADSSVTAVTHHDGEVARVFSISPDGRSVVYERARSLSDAHPDLWVMDLDGSNPRLLLRDGRSPSWGRTR